MTSNPGVAQFTEHRFRGIFPTRRRFALVSQGPVRLRGVPSLLPMEHAGINTQRVAPGGLVLSTVAALSGTPAAYPLLAGALCLQLGFGVRQGLRLYLKSRQQKRILKTEGDAEQAAGPPPVTAKVLARLNRENALRAAQSMYPAGILSSLVQMTAASALLTKPVLLGSLGLSAAAASTVLLSVGVPMLSVLSATAAVYSAYYIRFSYARQKYVPDLLLAAVTGRENEVHELMCVRLHQQRVQAALSGTASLGLAIGAPLTVFGGPYGLAVLVPSVILSIATSYTWARRIAYVPQLTIADRLVMTTKNRLIGEVARAQDHYAILKNLKAGLRPLYPYGLNSPLRVFGKLRAGLQRRQPHVVARLPSAEQTVHTYWDQHLAAEARYQEVRKRVVEHRLNRKLARGNTAGVLVQRVKLRTSEDAIETLQRAKGDMRRGPCAPLSERFAWLLDALVQDCAFDAFAHRLMKDRKFFYVWQEHAISHRGKRWSVSKASLETTFAAQTPFKQDILLHRAYVLARSMWLIDGKFQYQYRTRELLDMLSLHLRVSAKLRPPGRQG